VAGRFVLWIGIVDWYSFVALSYAYIPALFVYDFVVGCLTRQQSFVGRPYDDINFIGLYTFSIEQCAFKCVSLMSCSCKTRRPTNLILPFSTLHLPYPYETDLS